MCVCPVSVRPHDEIAEKGKKPAQPPGPSALTVAFGPRRTYPSWEWVGFDTARELAKRYQVQVYDGTEASPPECDVLFVIKERPLESFLDAARARGARIVFCPIDLYESREEIEADANFLKACDMILVHCERHLPMLERYCERSYYVEHYGRFTLPHILFPSFLT